MIQKLKWKGSGDKTRRDGLPLLSIGGVQLCHFFMRAGACPHEAKVCARVPAHLSVCVCVCVRVCVCGAKMCARVPVYLLVCVCVFVHVCVCVVKVCGKGVCVCAHVSLGFCVSYNF